MQKWTHSLSLKRRKVKVEFYNEAQWALICLFMFVCLCEPVHLRACVRRLWLSGDDDPGFVDSTFRFKTRGSLADDVCAVYVCACLCN